MQNHTRDLIERYYAAFNRDDAAGMLDCLTDAIEPRPQNDSTP